MTAVVVLLAALVAAEAGALAWLAVLLRRARAEAADLRRARRSPVARAEPLQGLRSRGLLPTGRDAVRTVWDTATLVRERGLGGALRSSIDDLAAWARVEQPDLVRLAARDGTVTIMFSDIEGSTALNDELGDRQWVRVLDWHDRLVRARVLENDGHVVKAQGDGYMVAFAEAAQAVRCAVKVQRDLERDARRPSRTTVRVRMGVHRGEAVHRDGDLFGRNVAAAARVAAHADGGQLLVTDAVLDALDAGRVTVLGTDEVELRGLGGRHRVHALATAKRSRRRRTPADEERSGVHDEGDPEDD